MPQSRWMKHCFWAVWLGCFSTALLAQTAAFQAKDGQPLALAEWMERLHEAARNRAYTGTFVVQSGSEMAVSKIWHVCDGRQQFERIETLTGAPRVTLRRNDEVMTFVPERQMVLKERRDALRIFPDFLRTPSQKIEAYYQAWKAGRERVAGVDAEVVDVVPKDALRHGYRIWSESTTGLVVKLQTRDVSGKVLEQVAFTELQLNAPVKTDVLARQMTNTKGMRVVEPQITPTQADKEGWSLKTDVPGFQSMSTQVRSYGQGQATVQWIFSDGMASVSLFLQPFDSSRHKQEGALADGVMQSVSKRMGDYWVTAMGEVPAGTLGLFMQSLQRTR
jgi:sigma-E factor negative regulatory protein RseB